MKKELVIPDPVNENLKLFQLQYAMGCYGNTHIVIVDKKGLFVTEAKPSKRDYKVDGGAKCSRFHWQWISAHTR